MAEIIKHMYEKQYEAGQYICTEGGVGTELFVLAGRCFCLMYACLELQEMPSAKVCAQGFSWKCCHISL